MLKSVAKFALDNIWNLLSINSIANTLTSDGRVINGRTVERYLEGLTESFFLYKASRYDIKGKQYLKTGENEVDFVAINSDGKQYYYQKKLKINKNIDKRKEHGNIIL